MGMIFCDVCGKELFNGWTRISFDDSWTTSCDVCADCETAIKGFIKLRKQMLEYDRKQKERSYGRNEK